MPSWTPTWRAWPASPWSAGQVGGSAWSADPRRLCRRAVRRHRQAAPGAGGPPGADVMGHQGAAARAVRGSQVAITAPRRSFPWRPSAEHLMAALVASTTRPARRCGRWTRPGRRPEGRAAGGAPGASACPRTTRWCCGSTTWRRSSASRRGCNVRGQDRDQDVEHGAHLPLIDPGRRVPACPRKVRPRGGGARVPLPLRQRPSGLRPAVAGRPDRASPRSSRRPGT